MLRENYKNDKFAGRRRYDLLHNDDGTVSLDDVTVYAEEGDIFGAADINKTNAAINIHTKELNEIRGTIIVQLSATAWGSNKPYRQEVPAVGITANDTPIVSVSLEGVTSADDIKAQTKAFGCVDRVISNDGSVAFYCYDKQPSVDFKAVLKGR